MNAKVENNNDIYQSVLYNAWIETRMERDKSLLALSSAGIGLIVTLLISYKVYEWPVWIALVSFFITIVSCLLIFRFNSDYIESLLKNKNSPDEKTKRRLILLDRVAFWGFLCAVVFTISFGYMTFKEVSKMAEDKKAPIVKKNSLEGLERLVTIIQHEPTSTQNTPSSNPAPSINHPANTDKPSASNSNGKK